MKMGKKPAKVAAKASKAMGMYKDAKPMASMSKKMKKK